MDVHVVYERTRYNSIFHSHLWDTEYKKQNEYMYQDTYRSNNIPVLFGKEAIYRWIDSCAVWWGP